MESNSVPRRKTAPLFLSRRKYNHLWSHLNVEQEKKEVSKQEEAYREFLKLASKQMTETWENSIEKSRLRKTEEGKQQKLKAQTKGEY